MMEKVYEAPQVEVLEVAVEQGYCASVAGDYQYGGNFEG